MDMTTKTLGFLIALLLLNTAAWAQQKGAVELVSVAEVEVSQKNAKGEQEVKRVEASKANVPPGETVIFTNYYTNKGQDAATGVVITNPIPQHMVYLDKSAEGAGSRIEFSVDGGKTYGPANKLVIRAGDGKERPAISSEYTHIRWTLVKPVARGGKGSVSFRAKVK
jgi:uncharacterized repeat protein (TIGR01451 family)